MGFREDAVLFKQALPQLETLALSEKDLARAITLLQDCALIKHRMEEFTNELEENKAALFDLQKLLQVEGFRYGQIAFAGFERTSPSGKPYTVKSIEVLPE